MSFPHSHPACLSPLPGARTAIATADAILILDSDVPWVPAAIQPRTDALIFHVDPDPIKSDMLLFYIPATARYKASSQEAIVQLTGYISSSPELQHELLGAGLTFAAKARQEAHQKHLEAVALRGQPPRSVGMPASVGYLCAQLRDACPAHTQSGSRKQ